jgi:hypothetical protein
MLSPVAEVLFGSTTVKWNTTVSEMALLVSITTQDELWGKVTLSKYFASEDRHNYRLPSDLTLYLETVICKTIMFTPAIM